MNSPSDLRAVAKAHVAESARPYDERFEFRVRLVRNDAQLSKALHIRSAAYGRHYPTLAEILAQSEQEDRQTGSVILLAESKATDEPVGTLRVTDNTKTPSVFETNLNLPERYRNTTIAHVARLAVINGPKGHSVKTVLFKSLYRYCLAMQLRVIMVGAASPVDKDYIRLTFDDVYAEGERFILPFSKGIPMRVMALEVDTLERRWMQRRHPLYSFFFDTFTPDIEVFSSVSSMWSSPRKRETTLPTARASALDFPLV